MVIWGDGPDRTPRDNKELWSYGVGLAQILLTGHLVETVREPLLFLAETRINGAHRAELARLTSASGTVGDLERAEVQALIRQTRADPEHFMDGTPGQGATAQLARVGQALALVSSAVVLAAYAWWLVPCCCPAPRHPRSSGSSPGRRHCTAGCGVGRSGRACTPTYGPQTPSSRPPRARSCASSGSGTGRATRHQHHVRTGMTRSGRRAAGPCPSMDTFLLVPSRSPPCSSW